MEKGREMFPWLGKGRMTDAKRPDGGVLHPAYRACRLGGRECLVI